MGTSPDESVIPGVVGRRSARLSIIVPVTVRGTDAAGQPFKENTWTISVNKHGGRLAAFHQLAAAAQIVIENPLLGRTAKARVRRVCEKRFAEDPYEVCIELLEQQNVWGVKLPPEDWQKERQVVPGDQKSPTPQAAPHAPKTPEATAENGGVVETSHLAPRGLPAELGENTGALSQFSMAVSALSRFAGEANAAPPHPAAHGQDAMGAPKAPAGHPQGPDSLALKALQEKIGEAQSLLQELSVLTDRVQSTRVEVENLHSKAALEFQAQCKRATEQAKAELDELVRDTAIQARKICKEEDALELLKEGLRSAQQQCVEETQRQLAAAHESTLTSLQRETGVNLASYRERLHTTLLEMQAQQTKEIEKGIQTTLQNILDSLRTQTRLTADESAARVTAAVRNRVEEALSAFRSRLSRILADHAPREQQGPPGTP
jgi:cellobiose-specific phosphotransferase system component IIA